MAHTELSRVLQIAVVVKDLARATAFYRDVLGLRFLFEAPPQLAFFDCGGVRLMLGTAENAEIERMSSMIYFEVGDIQETCRVLTEKGAPGVGTPHLIAKMPDHDLWLVELRDSEGNHLGLMEQRKR